LQRLRAGDGGGAIAALSAAAALAPDDPNAWTTLGVALDRADSPSEACACLDRSLRIDPAQPFAWLLLGLGRRKLQDPQGAEAAYREALRRDPRSAPAWQCLGSVLEEGKDDAGAIRCFLASIDCGAATASVWANLGKLYVQTGQWPAAFSAYAEAVRLDPASPHYRQMMDRARFLVDALCEEPSDPEAPAASLQTVSSATLDADPRWLESACNLLASFGHIEAATRVARAWALRTPGSATARYLLDALLGVPGLARAPTNYIVESFDAFAAGFDTQLVFVLGYDIPGKLCALVRETASSQEGYDALDAGCGTGLCGPLIRPLSRRLVGADLSPKMLEQAARRGVYDALVQTELTDFLEISPGAFDLVVAADVWIYFGDLGPLFAALSRAIRPGGLLAFSVESAGGDGYRVQPSGRFAHGEDYVRRMAAPAFEEARCVRTTIRLEAKDRVGGCIFVFRRKGEYRGAENSKV
jgi:predicted TPR repeat methyltransferase